MNLFVKLALLGIGLFAIIMISLGVIQETYRRYQIQREIEDLEVQAEKKEKENQKLRGLVEYFRTNDFQEREAKEKLSLQKENEKVVLVKDAPQKEDKIKEEKESSQNTTQKDERSNYKKWWDYFFASGK